MSVEMLLPEVKPGIGMRSCRLTVVEKHNVRSAKNSPMKFMHFILMDVAGNKVQAAAFQGDIAVIDQRLALHSTYLISNAFVKPATDLRYCVDLNYQFVWTFTRRTLIQDVTPEDAIDCALLLEAGTKPFHDFYDCHLRNEKISALAAVVQKLPRAFIVTDGHQKPAWDIVLINEECIPVPLTLWEDFVTSHGTEIERLLEEGNYPLVLIERVVVNLFQGLTLATRFDTRLELNPTGERALLLKKWLAENVHKVDQMMLEKVYEDALSALAKPLSQPHTPVAGLEAKLNEIPVAWVLGKFVLMDTSDDGFYVGCDYCNRRVYAMEGVTFECMFCGQKKGKSVKRFRLDASLSDGTSSVPVTLFTADILSLFEFVHMDVEDTVDLEAFDAKLQKIDIIAGVKRTKFNEERAQGNLYTVVCVAEPKPFTDAVGKDKIPPPGPILLPEAKKSLNFETVKDLPVHGATSTDEPLTNQRARKRKLSGS
ncbi:unnamed protein product [Cuscuta epithymum]|uniref:Replication factor A C-terminal domain-containing protein n=1 Tax=Cuscuta epithymum TaxID=186058 RepID=A0AAV0CKR0_9ASTE|nr:unnamed protein product [Cuscuta epithymum]